MPSGSSPRACGLGRGTPNYFGEILLWTGIAVAALPALEGWQHVTLISPVFVYLLLTRISGVRMLEGPRRPPVGERRELCTLPRRYPHACPAATETAARRPVVTLRQHAAASAALAAISLNLLFWCIPLLALYAARLAVPAATPTDEALVRRHLSRCGGLRRLVAYADIPGSMAHPAA